LPANLSSDGSPQLNLLTIQDPQGEKDRNGDWHSWGIEQTKILALKLAEIGIDMFDVTSGGNLATQKVEARPGYNVQFAKEVKKAVPNMVIGSVGLISTTEQGASHTFETRRLPF
jgi:2,4-dienoyl-CoA reductase-like NADH-dependent reductase (Old Yellow Enzyme family)